MPIGSRAVGRTSRALLLYVAAACVFTWPLAVNPGSLFGAEDPGGDPSLNLWALGWNLHALSTDPASVLNGRVFDANIFHPARQTLAYSDHLLLQATALWPLYAATENLILCYNALLLGSLIACALAMHVFARTLTGSESAAFAAGLVFGFAPYHFTHLTHVQLQALYFLPLALLFLHRVFASGGRKDAVALGVVMGLQAASSVYYGLIGAIGVASAAIGLALLQRRVTDWRLVRRGLMAAAIAALVALPPLLPYLRVEREAAAGRNLYEAAIGSAVPASYLQAPPSNLLYGRTGWLRPGPGARLPRKDGPEQALFPGFSVMLLAAAAVLAAPHSLRATAVTYALVGVVGVALSMGPGIRPLYATLYELLPGMEAIRAPARFSVLALAALAVLAAIAVRGWEAYGPSRSRLMTSIALVAISVEFLNGSIAFPRAPSLTSEAGAWLAAQPGAGPVICLPIGYDEANTPCMLQSLQHRRRIVNGYSGLRPPFFPAIVDAMSAMPSPESLLMLRDIGVEYVVSDSPLVVPPALAGALAERARPGGQVVYQLTWSPEVETSVAAAVPAAGAPDPGPAPFAVGESAGYQVRWTSGPMAVPAGDMTIDVAAPRGDEAFRFVASARTAPWVARFFEADARLATTADRRLLPIEHTQTIVEGKRHTDRRVVFDFTRRQVEMTTGGASVTLPLAPDARDPMTALFYVRTLPLQPGSTFSLPLSDNGRPARLEVGVGPVETVEAGGRAFEAWKVEPRVRQRIERRQPLAITAWVTADARRIPVRVDVEGPFGTVRVELTNYRQK
jgi:hypothetical protein